MGGRKVKAGFEVYSVAAKPLYVFYVADYIPMVGMTVAVAAKTKFVFLPR